MQSPTKTTTFAGDFEVKSPRELLEQEKEFDAIVFDITKVPAHEIAQQLTLIDLPLFKAITPEELSSCEWTGKKKYDLCPNVVNFTKRFNQVSFWVTTEILENQTAKVRAQKVAHFIRIAKKLTELNNLNSSKAVVSSLYSAPIHRLKKTWNLVPKRDTEKLDRLHEIVSEESNNKALRAYLEEVKLPCIPYLGMYLTDLTYINTIHPSTGGLDLERTTKLNQVLRIIADFQHSTYDNLKTISHIQSYLRQLKYIDELQKFVEDDNYKLSLRIEPNTSEGSLSDETSVKRSDSNRSNRCEHTPFLPSYRRMSSSSETGFMKNHLRSSVQLLFKVSGPFRSPSPYKKQSEIFGEWYQASNGYDSELDQDEPETHPIILNLKRRPSSITIPPLISKEFFRLEGFLKRKTFIKNGSRPGVGTWRRFWVGLTCSTRHLVYFLPKQVRLRGRERENFRKEPHKVVPVVGCTVFVCTEADSFRLTVESGDTVYLFRAGSQHNASIWYEAIKEAAVGWEETQPKNLIDLL